METHPKKQLTIIAERPLIDRLVHYLDEAPVTGYTILPALAGRGSEGNWSREGMIGDTGQMVQFVCILDEASLDTVLDQVFAMVEPYSGVVTVQDVSVVRAARF